MSLRSALHKLSILLLASLSTHCGDPLPRVAVDPSRPPIVLITLDTTRRDRLGCYGYGPATSPHTRPTPHCALRQQSDVHTPPKGEAASGRQIPLAQSNSAQFK